MPFVAACPFCRRKVQAPDSALGHSVACKKCKNHFTLAPEDGLSPPEATARAALQYIIAANPTAGSALPLRPPATSPTVRTIAPPLPEARVPAQIDTAEHVVATTPETPRLHVVQPPQMAPQPAIPWNGYAVAALLLSCVAFSCATFRGLSWLAYPLAGAGLLAGVIGLVATPIETRRDAFALLLGGALSVAVLMWMLF